MPFNTKPFILFITIASMIGWTACQQGPDKQELSQEIEKLEEKVSSDTTGMPDMELANKTIKKYVAYAREFPQDEKAPKYLFNAGRLSMGVNKGNEAIKYFKEFYKKYPDNENAPYSLFIQGFIYENLLQNKEKAVKYYRDFVSNYPEHELADDADYSIQNIDKTDEELIREFEERMAKEEK